MSSSSTARVVCGYRSSAVYGTPALIARALSTAPIPPPPPPPSASQQSIGPADYRHKSNLTSLPPQLKTALTSLLSPSPTLSPDSSSTSLPPPITGPRIRSASLRIFDSLRSTTGTVNPFRSNTQLKIPSLANPDRHLTPHHVAYDHDTSLAYLAARFPACFTGIKRVLGEAVSKMGGVGPNSVLDVGTGPGTAVWALRAVEDEIAHGGEQVPRAHVTAVDVNQNMLSVAKQLARAGDMQGNVEWAKYTPASHSASYDMSIAAYVLGEIEDAQMRQRLLKSMWRLTTNMLVLVDRGTPHGYQRMMEARDWFIGQSKEGEHRASILAPCPHMAKCPLAGNGRDWCHFSQRMERPTETQRTKHAKSNLEDIKFSYLIIKKHPASPSPSPSSSPSPSTSPSTAWPRVLSVPLKRGGHVLVDVCTPRGTADRMIVTKSLGKDTYKAARKLGWGDQWPFAAKVYVPGRGMGRVDEDACGKGEKKKEKKGGVGKKVAMEPVGDEAVGVLFAAEPAPRGPRLTLVDPSMAAKAPVVTRAADETAAEQQLPEPEPRATRGGRAARGSKKLVSPFAALLAQQQQQVTSADESANDTGDNAPEAGNPRKSRV